jgi:hypothetical protein
MEALTLGLGHPAINRALQFCLAYWTRHRWTKWSARATADALDALGRTDEAKALREKYGITELEKPKPS